MSVIAIPAKFAASDGTAFDTSAEAERHDRLVNAVRGLASAKKEFVRALVETQKTADGKIFSLRPSARYFYITSGFHGMPTLVSVPWFGGDFELCDYFDNHRTNSVSVRIKTINLSLSSRETSNETQTYRISDLYASEEAARVELLKQQEEWLSKRAAEVKELRDALEPK
jgi:hypothetical protein